MDLECLARDHGIGLFPNMNDIKLDFFLVSGWICQIWPNCALSPYFSWQCGVFFNATKRFICAVVHLVNYIDDQNITTIAKILKKFMKTCFVYSLGILALPL